MIHTELYAPGICVWGEISCTGIISPFLLGGTVTGDSYLYMMENTVWLEIFTLWDDIYSIFQQDHAPPCFYRYVTGWMDTFQTDRLAIEALLNSRIFRLDSPGVLWGFVKENEYATKHTTVNKWRCYNRRTDIQFIRDVSKCTWQCP